MSKAVLTTYAKLNLVLKVFLSERPGALHPLCSVFQTISLSDQLHIVHTRQPGWVLETDHPGLQDPSGNLLTKIYTDFQAEIPFGMHVRLVKNIPIGGGLGGGSGNAAGFLAYLNLACGWGFSQAELMGYGMRYGSDVPFFFEGGTALVQGFGEQVLAWQKPYSGYFVLANPGIHVATPGVFRAFDAQGLGTPVQDFVQQWQSGFPLGDNDLASVVFQDYPIYRELGHCLQPLGYRFFLSGSGATVFIPVADEAAQRMLVTQLAAALPDWWVAPVSTVMGPGYRIETLVV